MISVLVIGITVDKNHVIFASPATHLTYSVHCCHCDFAKKNPDLLEKNPETQTRAKNPDLVGKNLLLQYHSPGGGGVLRS